jgi:hypothetical protein
MLLVFPHPKNENLSNKKHFQHKGNQGQRFFIFGYHNSVLFVNFVT